MKRKSLMMAFAVLISLSLPQTAMVAYGQSLLEVGLLTGYAGGSVPDGTPDGQAYADGVRAINDGRWSDAIAIFSRVGDQSGGHAGAALYWKAYAENKLGQSGAALDDCGKLRREFTGSQWIDECGALEIEIRARSGQPAQPQVQPSDDLKLLALATLMQHDEKRALAQIDEILNSDSSEKLKQGALFIMGEHHSDTIFPQIARVSSVEGDVRIFRTEDKKHAWNSTWEQVVADLPLESGYSLVTGNGRAEVEFEDASTLYLGENSVLICNDLHTSAGIPHTEVALLTGTVTLHIHPYVTGEWFLLRMPTDSLVSKYPEITDLRVSSYTDGIAIASLGTGTLGLNGASRQTISLGHTYYFKDGRRIIDAGPIQPPDFAEWDTWVAARYAARSAATAAMLKASGLASPVPGLADMQGKGAFFPCEPYGTCWEPSTTPQETGQPNASEPKPEPAEQTAQAQPQTPGQTTKPARNIGFVGKPSPSGLPPEWSQAEDLFPCMPGELQPVLMRRVVPGSVPPYDLNSAFYPASWVWAVCHSGSWIYRGNRYLWVAGRRHHHSPVHWVKYGSTVGFVPIHPRDVKNHPPVNRINPVFAVNNKDGRVIAKIELPAHSIELLKEPPRGLRNAYMPPLARADAPRMEAHQITELPIAKGAPIKTTAIPITFDHKSQSFLMARQETHGARTVTVTAPMNNHIGNLQARAGGAGGGSGTHGGGAGSTGSRSGGGSGSGGGGSHSGATGSGSSGSSSAGASSASSTGGSHH